MKISAFLFVSGLLIHPSIWSAGVDADSHVQVEPLATNDCLEPTSAGDNHLVLFDETNTSLKGWSHIVRNPDRFPLVSFENSKYAVDESSILSDPDCEGSTFFRSILTRKMGNWGQQHANGIEPVFADSPVEVNEMESVSLWIKLNSKDSVIPSKELLKQTFGKVLKQEQIDKLDNGQATLGFTFVEPGYNDQSQESLNAAILVDFDPATDFDKWLKLTIPMESFSFSFEKNYANRPVEMDTVLDRQLVAFRINPETSGGIVSRNFLNDSWVDTNPELYKEISLSIRRIEISLK